MRDPARIDRILDKIRTLWVQVPDQRLGQLLANYAYGHHRDIFYFEDDKVEEMLDDCIAMNGGGGFIRRPTDIEDGDPPS